MKEPSVSVKPVIKKGLLQDIEKLGTETDSSLERVFMLFFSSNI
jgi:hypothetical protein